jgi:Cu/Ag efflux protein CusF
LARAFTVRLRVFVCEQGVPADIEIDADDRRAVHFLMKTSFGIVAGISLAMLCSSFLGCEPKAKDDNNAASTVAKDYALEGRVVEVGENRTAITIDHKEIPNLMKAMKMEFKVQDPSVLDGIDSGDNVQGRLKVEGGQYIITSLREK